MAQARLSAGSCNRRMAEIKRAGMRNAHNPTQDRQRPAPACGAISPWVAGRDLSSNEGEGAIGFRKTLSALIRSLWRARHCAHRGQRASSPTDHNAPFPDNSSMSRYTCHRPGRDGRPQKSELVRKGLPSRSGLRSDFPPHIPRQSSAHLRVRRARWQLWARPRAREPTRTAI